VERTLLSAALAVAVVLDFRFAAAGREKPGRARLVPPQPAKEEPASAAEEWPIPPLAIFATGKGKHILPDRADE
jgi:hypothetical protein